MPDNLDNCEIAKAGSFLDTAQVLQSGIPSFLLDLGSTQLYLNLYSDRSMKRQAQSGFEVFLV